MFEELSFKGDKVINWIRIHSARIELASAIVYGAVGLVAVACRIPAGGVLLVYSVIQIIRLRNSSAAKRGINTKW